MQVLTVALSQAFLCLAQLSYFATRLSVASYAAAVDLLCGKIETNSAKLSGCNGRLEPPIGEQNIFALF